MGNAISVVYLDFNKSLDKYLMLFLWQKWRHINYMICDDTVGWPQSCLGGWIHWFHGNVRRGPPALSLADHMESVMSNSGCQDLRKTLIKWSVQRMVKDQLKEQVHLSGRKEVSGHMTAVYKYGEVEKVTTKFRLNVGKNFLIIRTMPKWDGMATEVVSSPSLELFKQRLNGHLSGMLEWHPFSVWDKPEGS